MLPQNYHDMSENDQAAHWVGYIYRGMRWAGEDGYDEISILDGNELEKWKKLDPTIERLMPRILEGLAEMWLQPKNSFFQRVNKQMGTAFCRPNLQVGRWYAFGKNRFCCKEVWSLSLEGCA